MLKENRTAIEKIKLLNSKNTLEYDILKLAEESTELNDVLIKMVTKPNRRDDRIPHLIEELGDTLLRIQILITRLDIQDSTTARFIEKLDKLVAAADENKYVNY